MLTDAGYGANIYHDTMTAADKRGRRVSALSERAAMLRPTSRKAGNDVIGVATIRALALNGGPDLIAVLMAAAERGATVHALAEELEVPPGAPLALIRDAASAWDTGRRNAQTAEGRAIGTQRASEAAAARRQRALAIARPLWVLPTNEITSQEIATRAGVSIATLHNHLGGRRAAQRRQGKEKGSA
ncbi:hypothetical protein AA13594_2249 [Gluconacetobacter azotocaptans DSM 13594]|nr:hypothetical protein AA13594_2249 [Gluconacetobacter azotocaptans DSM 13594]